MDEKIIYKIEPLEITTYLLRISSIVVIGLCIYFLNVNPTALSIFSSLALVVLLISRTSRLVLTTDELKIEHRNIIPKMSKIEHIKLSDIKEIGFESEFKPIGRHFLPMGYMLSKENEVIIRLYDNTEVSQTQIGTKKQFVLMLEKLNEYASKQPGANKM